jgi:hypothetical protein
VIFINARGRQAEAKESKFAKPPLYKEKYRTTKAKLVFILVFLPQNH